MIVFLAALGLLCLYGISLPIIKSKKPADGSRYYADYLSVEKCNAIKGVFILIVMMSHIRPFLSFSNSIWDKAFTTIIGNYIGQSMVSLFLLYSGYGIMLSIDKKGDSYVKGIPTKRFLKVLLHFDIAVVIYGLLQLALGKTFPWKTYLLSLTGWEALGNSNWYIFTILCLYIITWLSFTIARHRKHIGFLLCVLFSAALITVLYIVRGNEHWWYDTIPCYLLGMAVYLYKKELEGFLFRNRSNWYLAIGICAALYIGTILWQPHILMELVRHALFATTFLLFTMKVSINNRILQFFGKHLFSIYILQRIPMLILSHFNFTNPYFFLLISFAVTILLAVPFDWALGKLDGKLFTKSNLPKKMTT